jgi:putative Mg2+ transporter-C (MgtC) family protein
MIIGLEREWRQKPAGLRTNMLVSLAAAAFTIISFELYDTSLDISESTSGDPIRVIEGLWPAWRFWERRNHPVAW